MSARPVYNQLATITHVYNPTIYCLPPTAPSPLEPVSGSESKHESPLLGQIGVSCQGRTTTVEGWAAGRVRRPVVVAAATCPAHPADRSVPGTRAYGPRRVEFAENRLRLNTKSVVGVKSLRPNRWTVPTCR
ncbi:hypothetical protein FS749_015736 [Ceratobasidium sp. UAMH 11750]|nr:hypothetical protein FS749_015736 [Ceratobasidium sp. UAMH 11750]